MLTCGEIGICAIEGLREIEDLREAKSASLRPVISSASFIFCTLF